MYINPQDSSAMSNNNVPAEMTAIANSNSYINPQDGSAMSNDDVPAEMTPTICLNTPITCSNTPTTTTTTSITASTTTLITASAATTPTSGTGTATTEMNHDLQGASHTMGGVLQGWAQGNVYNMADTMEVDDPFIKLLKVS